MKSIRISTFLLVLCQLFAASQLLAQAKWDNSGNDKLSGEFFFRELILVGDATDPGQVRQAVSQYGTITFDGNGGFNLVSKIWDSAAGAVNNPGFSGTYRIASSGHGFIDRDRPAGGNVYGLIAGDVFIGSSTEAGFGNIFIATRKSEVTVADLNRSYTVAYMDFAERDFNETRDASFELVPDGEGRFATIKLKGYKGADYEERTQSIGGAKYSFENGAGTMNLQGIVTGRQLMNGFKEFYVSPDRKFIFGGATDGWDLFVGVATPDSNVPANTMDGQFFYSGIDIERSRLASDGIAPLGTYYGSFSANNGTLIGAHRVRFDTDSEGFDYVYNQEYAVQPDGAIEDMYDFTHTITADGAFRVGYGYGDFVGIAVGMAIPSFSGPGPFINPVGALNAASYAPFTAGVARGTVMTLFGSELAPDVLVDGTFPTVLSGVSVRVNGELAPVYVVAPGQVSFVMPYDVEGSIARIEVIRDGVVSNPVTVWINTTSPGFFTVPPFGVGNAAALHADFSLVTADNPALPGETILVYLTGLGAIDPEVEAGAPGPVNPLSRTTANLYVTIGGVEATIVYSGLAPNFGGLYQLNLTLGADTQPGEALIEISGPDTFVAQAVVPVGSATN